MEEPLLHCSGKSNPDTLRPQPLLLQRLDSLRSVFARLQRSLRFWWRVTTDTDFLRSKISRRPSLKITLLLLAIGCLALDAPMLLISNGYIWWVLGDILLVFAACGYSVSSTCPESLIVDAVVVVVVTLYINFQQAIASKVAVGWESRGSYPPVWDWFPGVMVAATFAGLHSLVVVWFWVCLMSYTVWDLVLADVDSIALPWDDIGFGTLVTVAAVALEFSMAHLYCEWHTQLRRNQKLLEGATDGYGICDCVSGLVLEASPKMLETFGCESLVGCPLALGVDDSQASSLADFVGASDRAPVPVLVTWRWGSIECDVRLLPYELQDSHIAFSVHRVGEARSQVTQPAVTEECRFPGHPASGGRGGDAHAPVSSSRVVAASVSSKSLSLSSWTISDRGSSHQKQKRRQGTRNTPPSALSPRSTPPAPLMVSSFPSYAQAKAARRAKLARRSAAAIEEGRPRMPEFQATPQGTRLHSLQTVARSCNNTGSGCCHKHVAWMGLQCLISEIMLQPCDDFRCFSGWQCPECLAVHDYEGGPDVDEEEKHDEQFCPVCLDSVTPILPRSVELREAAAATTAAAEETALSHLTNEAAALTDSSGCDADLEVV